MITAQRALALLVQGLTPWTTHVVEVGGLTLIQPQLTGPVNPTSLIIRRGDIPQALIVTNVAGKWEREVRFDSMADLRSAARKIVFG